MFPAMANVQCDALAAILPVLFDDVDNDVDDDNCPATSWLSGPLASAASASRCTFAIAGNT